MITIEGISDKYILDLNTSTSGHRELSVDSSSNGSKLTWVVSYVSSDLIDAYPFSTNIICFSTGSNGSFFSPKVKNIR